MLDKHTISLAAYQLEAAKAPAPYFSFYNEQDLQGKLYVKDGKFTFEGEVDASAEVFFKYLVEQCNRWIVETRNEAFEEAAKIAEAFETGRELSRASVAIRTKKC
jgi:hypothetical protein